MTYEIYLFLYMNYRISISDDPLTIIIQSLKKPLPIPTTIL